MTPTPTQHDQPADRQPARVAFVGAGPGDAGLMTRARSRPARRRRRRRHRPGQPARTFVARHARAGRRDHRRRPRRARPAADPRRAAPSSSSRRPSRSARRRPRRPAHGRRPGHLQRPRRGGAGLPQGRHRRSRSSPASARSRPCPTYAGVPLTSAASPARARRQRRRPPSVDWSRSTADNVTVVVLGAPESLAPRAGRPAGRRPRRRRRPWPSPSTARRSTSAPAPRPWARSTALMARPSVEFPSLAVVGSTVGAARAAVVVRDQAAVRLERPRAAHQGPGRRR